MTAGVRSVVKNIVAVLGLIYVFTVVLILKTIVWQPHITSFGTDSFDRIAFVHVVWALGYFPAAFVAGMVSSLVLESRRRWLWFILFLACLIPSLVSQDFRTWHDAMNRGGALVVATLTTGCAVLGFVVGERWFWKASRGEAA